MSSRHIVLYADDDIDDLELVRDAFGKYSRNVDLITFQDGYQVISYLKNLRKNDSPPCLLILDINMPRLNGKETLVRLRELDSFNDLPVILFTTSSQPVDKEFARYYHAGFITKPVDATQLELIANQFIEHCTDDVKKEIYRYPN